uniref:Uncharacterized protein n=1 Tax=Ascaris lumbricoides TaxID=6252 RepID=A0A9J2PRV7_ASCLU
MTSKRTYTAAKFVGSKTLQHIHSTRNKFLNYFRRTSSITQHINSVGFQRVIYIYYGRQRSESNAPGQTLIITQPCDNDLSSSALKVLCDRKFNPLGLEPSDKYENTRGFEGTKKQS